MTNFIKNLLHFSLLPAALIVFGKAFGIVIANLIFNFNYFVDVIPAQGIVTKIFFMNPADTWLVTNFSDGTILFLILIGQIMMVIKFTYFSQVNSKPKIIARIVHLNLMEFLTKTDKLYPMATGWILFSWVSVAIILHNIYLQVTHPLMGLMAILAAVIYTWTIIGHFEHHLYFLTKQLNKD